MLTTFGILIGLFPATLSAQPSNVPAAVLPIYSGSETSSFFLVELADGRTRFADRLRRDPLQPRAQNSDNFFSMIGRPSGPTALTGDILFGPILTGFGTVRSALFVEASTGYVAYFEQPGKGGKLGTFTNAMGRPFGPIANQDGNFALLMRRDGTGSTEGAYLYHAGSGQALYLNDVDKLAAEPVVISTNALPRLTGPVTAVGLQNANAETFGYLLIDCGTGEIHYASLIAGTPARFNVAKLALNLKEAFGSAESPAALGHLTAVELRNSAEVTTEIFLLDPVSGEMAALGTLGSLPTTLSFKKSARNFFSGVSGDSTAGRYLTPIPHNDNDGETIGIWLWDSATRNLFYIANPTTLDAATPRVVRIGG